MRSSIGLTDDLESLALALESLDLRVAEHRGENTQAKADQLVRNIRSYLVPKLSDPEVPLSVVFAGPTGSGKSTLINSVSGFELSQTGPIRPTTTEPVALVSARNADRYATVGPYECQTVIGTAPILDDVVLVDTPDIDSTSVGHREIAETLIDHADVVVFVTSALRYADSVPWEVLRRAVSRGATVINVLNRYSGESSGAYVDLQSRLGAAGIETDVLRVPEHHLGDGQAVPALAVRELARRLVEVGRDRRGHQQEVLNRVLDSTLDQAGEVSTTLSGDVRWIQAEDESIRTRFQGAASYLDLSRVATLVDTGFPYESSPRKKKRWARKFTPHAEFEDDAVVVVDTDIRRLGYHASDLGPMIHRTLTGWSDFVRRVSAEVPKVRSDLGRAVLMQACLDESEVEPAVYLFGDEAQILVLRVRRDLIERLQVVYTHAGERLVEQHHEQVGEPDSAVLDERIAAVVARSHFADA